MLPEPFLWGTGVIIAIVVIAMLLEKNKLIRADWWPLVPSLLALILAYNYPLLTGSSLFIGIMGIGSANLFFNPDGTTDKGKEVLGLMKFAIITSVGFVFAAYAISFIFDLFAPATHGVCGRASPQGC